MTSSRLRAHASAALALTVTTMTACTLVRDFFTDTGTGVTDGGDRDGEPDGGETAVRCPKGVRGPAMVPADSYCMDRTEVSADEYDAFLDSGADYFWFAPSGCRSTNILSRLEPPDAAKEGNIPSGSYPAIVTWCGAQAYCQFAGKELCGAVGGGPLGAGADKASNAWIRACARGDEGRTYPYGNELVPDACAPGYEPPSDLRSPASGTTVRAVGSHPQCEGGYRGIFDLVGNAVEWIDSCVMVDTPAGKKTRCFVAGATECQETWLQEKIHHGAGIRCCSPPAP